MVDQDAICELVVQARAGHEQAMDTLAHRVEGRVCAYIYRVTLDSDLTQDLSQEVMLTMVRSLSHFNHPDRFWPWLYRIAQSKIQQHFRTKQRRLARANDETLREIAAENEAGLHDHGLREAMRRETVAKVLTAMRQLAEQYRAVLSLRCFDQLSYADIALTMDCSEVRARVLFYRAKEALKKQLTRQGIGKGMLVACLGLFGKVTAPADAAEGATAVTAASTHVALSTVVAANTIPIAALVATVAIAVGLSVSNPASAPPADATAPPPRQIRNLHFTTQLQNTGPEAENSLTKGAYEQWFQFPEGLDGPMLFRMQRWNADQTERLCAWLQDAQTNCYFSSGENKIYLNNYRVFWSSLRVRRLPTDDAAFTEFLDHVEGDLGDVVYTRDAETGMLASALDYRFIDAYAFRTEFEYNVPDAMPCEANWHADAVRVDERDAMHKRGWTYLRLSGRIGNRAITGTGRIPFFYALAQGHPAWLRLRIGDDPELVDCSDGAWTCSANGNPIATYPSGTFLEGLARPWMGMHTLDTVRRDAVRRRIRFTTAPLDDQARATVTLRPEGLQLTSLTYTIDTETDVIERIEFEINYQPAGEMVFTWLQDIPGVEQDFPAPQAPSALPTVQKQTLEALWLILLAQNELGVARASPRQARGRLCP
ncbi:MAG: sigma-70 family RNA polymerase sigma factor [Sedimentisphaerales bacterium]|nr:sigma-70 family RNA polymerase sigma factor [Sedimentisphaerales bacterium]